MSALFFGRDQETRELAGKLRTGAGGGLLAIVGPSGCGKSSLLQAGLLPLLDKEPGWFTVGPWVPGNDPLRELVAAVTAAADRLELGWSQSEVRRRLEAPGGLRELTDDLAGSFTSRRVLIAIDQTEELFTRASERDRAAVGAALCDAVDGSARVVATLRSEFLDDLCALPVLSGMAIDPYALVPLARDMLSLVITEPARSAGLRVDPELVSRMVADTESGDALPLLAFTLQQLAMDLPRGAALSGDRYRGIGGVHGALASHADTALTQAMASSGLSGGEVLAGLVRLVTLDNTGRRGRRRVDRATLPAPLAKAMDVFVEHRLLTTSGDEHRVWIGVAHEALFTAWDPLDEAITERTQTLQAARSVEQAAMEWDKAGRAPSYLWETDRLIVTLAALGLPPLRAREGLPGTPVVDIDPDGREFLTAARERISTIRRQGHRRRLIVQVGLAVLLVVAVVAAVIAFVQRDLANEERDTATARALVAQAEAARNSSPRLALRLGLAAHHIRPSAETNAGLVNTLITTRYTGTLPESDGSTPSVAFSPDGRTMVTGSSTGAVTRWDLSHPLSPRRLGEPFTVGSGQAVAMLAFPGSGSRLAVWSSDGTTSTISLWDLADPAKPKPLGDFTEDKPITSMAFSADGNTVAVGKPTGETVLWDVSDPVRPRAGRTLKPTGDGFRILSVAFSPTGKVLATGRDDGFTILWDLADPARPGVPLSDDTRRAVTSLAFSAKRSVLAVGRSDGTTDLWSFDAGPVRLGQPLSEHTTRVLSMAFSPTADVLATGSLDGTTILWDLTDPAQPRQLGGSLIGQSGGVSALSFAPDGTTLVSSSSEGGGAILWDLTERPRKFGQPLAGHDTLVNSVAFEGNILVTTGSDNVELRWDISNPEQPRQRGRTRVDRDPLYSLASWGQLDATEGPDNSVTLWDVADQYSPRRLGPPLTGHSNTVTAGAFSSDGKTLAAGGADGTTILWDISDPDRPRRLGQTLAGISRSVTAVAFAPNGSILAVGSSDGTTILWDISDPDRPRRIGPPLVGHPMAVNAVAFAPDDDILATGGSDGRTVLWDLRMLVGVVARACAVSGGLDETEWAQHIPGLSYQDTCGT